MEARTVAAAAGAGYTCLEMEIQAGSHCEYGLEVGYPELPSY